MSEELIIKIHNMNLPQSNLEYVINLIERHLENGGTEDDYFVAGVIKYAERVEREYKIREITNKYKDRL